MFKKILMGSSLLICLAMFIGCNQAETSKKPLYRAVNSAAAEKPEYFNLRPALEKEYGYTHAIKIGNQLKISGAVSMSDSGIIVAPGSMEGQMKNCYRDLDKILRHFGYTFKNVIAENIYTTNMQDFIKVSAFRNSIYKQQFPTGNWLEVKGLALPGQVIEIDMEAYK